MDRNDIGETTDPISSLQQDQISQSGDASDVFRFPGSKLIQFWCNSVRASDFIINSTVEAYKIPFFDLYENFVIPNRYSAFKFKDFVKMYHSCAHGADVQWKMQAYFLSFVFKQICSFWKQSVWYENNRTVFHLFQSG